MQIISNDIMDSGMIFLYGTRRSKLEEIMQIGLVSSTEGKEKWKDTLLPCSSTKVLEEYWWHSLQDDTPKIVMVYSIPKELTGNINVEDFLNCQMDSLCEEKSGIVDPTLNKEYVEYIKRELDYRNANKKKYALYRLSDDELRKLIGLAPRLVLPSIFVLGVMDYQTKEFELNQNYIGNLDNYQQLIDFYKTKIEENKGRGTN